MYTIREGLTFDDLLLQPKYSTVLSRDDVSLSVKIKNITYSHPIIPANMQSITGKEMAKAVIMSGGLAIIHRFMPIEEQLKIIDCVQGYERDFNITSNMILDHLGVSVGVNESHKENIKKFIDKGVKIFCIDIAHGDSIHGRNMTSWIRTNYPDVLIISGNVATRDGAYSLWACGADVVKCGIGNGSLCSTRIETGNGVPQMTALMDVAEAKEDFHRYNPEQQIYIISDGGGRNSGDWVKALCFADMIMTGNTFAGCVETPGTTLAIGDKTYKEYKGSSTHKSKYIEGVLAIVPTKGKFKNILYKLLQ
jgi:IMP dehydrogenase